MVMKRESQKEIWLVWWLVEVLDYNTINNHHQYILNHLNHLQIFDIQNVEYNNECNWN